MPEQPLDLASWRRYSKSNKDRCMVCGNPAVVSVRLTASPLTRGGNALAAHQFLYCHDHGIMRFGEALIRLNGGNIPGKAN